MKRIINGKSYNTETSALIAEWEGASLFDGGLIEYQLYQNRAGAFFVVTYEHPRGCDYEIGMRLVSRDEAAALALPSLGTIYNEAALVDDAEAAISTLPLRLPAGLKRQVEGVARKSGSSLNAWIMRAVEGAVRNEGAI